MVKLWICLWAVLVVLGSSTATAQTPDLQRDGVPPPHLSILEGVVVIDREGVSEPAVVNAPMLDGDRVRTEEGRAEILFPDGTALHLDRQTILDILAPDLLRLMRGRLVLHVVGERDPARAVRYQVDAPPASVQTDGPGEYRLELYAGPSGDELSLAVVSGAAAIATDAGTTLARAGERVRGLAGARPVGPEYFNSARWDAFDQWSMARRDERRGVVSVAYLPQEVRPYAGTFDRYGTWRQEPDYGYVWYPTVTPDWRPYYAGYWRPYPAWDSFWISADPWGWPTHHYGRWGFSLAFGWYWVPGRSWGAAWVHWAVAPGYVSWCPLGYYNRPVFGLWGVTGHSYARPIDPWRGWTVMPRHHFGQPVRVSRVALDGRRLDHGVRGTFVAQRAVPVHRIAVPRARAADAGTASPLGAAARLRDFSTTPRGASSTRTGRAVGLPVPPGPGGNVAAGRGGALSGRSAAGETQARPRRDATASASGPSPVPEDGVRTRGAGIPSTDLRPGGPSAGAARTPSRTMPGPFRPAGGERAVPAPPRSGAGPDAEPAGRQRWPDMPSAASRADRPAPRSPTTIPGAVPQSGLPAWTSPARQAFPAVPGNTAGPSRPPREYAAPTRQAPSAGYRAAPLPSVPPEGYRAAPSAGRGAHESPAPVRQAPRSGSGFAAPRSAPPSVSQGPRPSPAPTRSASPTRPAPSSRGASAPASRYNPGTAASSGSAAPRSGQSRRPPGRVP